jgi:hypothetical protein
MDIFEPYFKIKPIQTNEYAERLTQEIDLLTKMNYVAFVLKFAQIYDQYINEYPNLLRGSAGSSLLFYYLGINQIDPIKYSIPFARFLNPLRKSIPDIDIDIPSSIKNNLMQQIITSTSGVIRMASTIGTDNEHYNNLIKEDPNSCIPHNSGLVIYSPDQEHIINENKISQIQISLNKDNIESYGLKKIDVLANTAIEQLYQIDKNKKISDYDYSDNSVFNFISQDDGIGITYAETPLLQFIFKILNPKNIEELSICMGLVRPFACDLINEKMTFNNLSNEIIFDDDLIMLLSKTMNWNYDSADEIRRIFKKATDLDKMTEILNLIETVSLDPETKQKIKYNLSKLKKYGFCKAHSINYARLIYCLYWNKFYNEKNFWITTIKNVKGYYRDWVYIRKGLTQKLKFAGFKKCNPFSHFIYTGYWLNKEFMSRCYFKICDKFEQVVVQQDETTINEEKITLSNAEENEENEENAENTENAEELELETGINCEPDNKLVKCYFRGLIAGLSTAVSKNKKIQTIITIGCANNEFHTLYLNRKRDLSRYKQVMGRGYLTKGTVPRVLVEKITLF